MTLLSHRMDSIIHTGDHKVFEKVSSAEIPPLKLKGKIIWTERTLSGNHNSTDKRHTDVTTHCEHMLPFTKKGRMTQTMEPKSWKADPQATEDYSQTLKPNGVCSAGFKNCLGLVNYSFFLSLSPFLNGMSKTGIVHLSCVHAKLLQLCLTLCDPMDCNLSGSSSQGKEFL